MKKESHVRLLKLMIESRTSNEREAILIRQGKARVHASSAGHEGLMAVPFLLAKEDYLYPYYRGCHLMIAKGLDRETIAREFLAKETSPSQGRNMGAHCGSVEYNIFPSAGPTASQCLPAVGTAWGQKLDGAGRLTVCSIGDGATREGEFYEAICYAIQEQLPIIFLVEDNHYGISTATEKLLPFRLNIFNSQLFIKLEGNSVLNICTAAKEAVEKARTGKGPTILWCDVDRIASHTSGDDHRVYRSSQELQKLRDPLTIYSKELIKLGYITKQEIKEMWLTAQEEIKETYQQVIEEHEPQPKKLKLHLYGDEVKHKPLRINKPSDKINMVEAVNVALDAWLETDNKTILFGQDIEDPKGGVFGFTKGLSSKYPSRVINAPISEATIIGSAVGLAVIGYRPVFEIQFIDYITPGFDQLVSQVSSLRWRSYGSWSCPLVLYAPYGAYLPGGGMWHSQSNEGWWTHIPGLRVAIPSTPEDTLGLFWSAFQDQDPSLILIPKNIFKIRKEINGIEGIPFGKGKLIQSGIDVTVVGWGNAIGLISQASNDPSLKNVSIEIIDLRTLVPCDWSIIIQSLQKTGRLVVVQEDNRTSSFGASIIAEITTNQSYFNTLYAAPQLVARDDIHIPYHSNLEYAVLPSVGDVIKAIQSTLASDNMLLLGSC
jgi:2-oxoisovalerate dehydrogenase E1 component